MGFKEKILIAKKENVYYVSGVSDMFMSPLIIDTMRFIICSSTLFTVSFVAFILGNLEVGNLELMRGLCIAAFVAASLVLSFLRFRDGDFIEGGCFLMFPSILVSGVWSLFFTHFNPNFITVAFDYTYYVMLFLGLGIVTGYFFYSYRKQIVWNVREILIVVLCILVYIFGSFVILLCCCFLWLISWAKKLGNAFK